MRKVEENELEFFLPCAEDSFGKQTRKTTKKMKTELFIFENISRVKRKRKKLLKTKVLLDGNKTKKNLCPQWKFERKQPVNRLGCFYVTNDQ